MPLPLVLNPVPETVIAVVPDGFSSVVDRLTAGVPVEELLSLELLELLEPPEPVVLLDPLEPVLPLALELALPADCEEPRPDGRVASCLAAPPANDTAVAVSWLRSEEP